MATVKWLRQGPALLESSRARYGDVWTLRLMGGATFVFVSDPALVKAVLTADTDVLNGESRVITPLVGPSSVLVLNGPEHMTQRKLLLPPFHGERMRRYRDVMARICEEELASWPLHVTLPLLPRMEKITLDVIMSAIFGMTQDATRDELHARVSALIAYRDRPWTAVQMQVAFMRGKSPPRAFLRVRDPIDALIYEAIKRARQDPNLEHRDDILAMLVKATHDDGSPMTDSELRDELMTLLIQGHTSTANALAWTVERLVRHPEVLERLQTEAQTDREDYLDAVMKETLRLRPPIPIASRRAREPYVLGEYELAPETMIACNIWMLHRREDLYPEPDRFRPERFLEQPSGTYTWIPFGGGVRHCLGRAFAMTEIKVVLRTLLQQLRLAPAEQRDERIRKRGVGFSPSGSARVVLQERMPAARTAGSPA